MFAFGIYCTFQTLQVPSNGYPSIEALCLKGGTFDPPSWPDAPPCVKTCTNFPPIRGMDPVDPR